MNKRANLQREYSGPGTGDSARLIVRKGETLVTLVDCDESWQAGESGPQLAELQIGPGIGFDVQRNCWFATSTGYLASEGTQLWVTPLVIVSARAEAAFLDLRAPASNEEPITLEEVVQAVRASGIKHGLARQRIEVAWTMFKSNGRLASPVRIAQCTAPDEGRPAGIEYALPVCLVAGIIGEPDEQMDYHERNLVTNVNVGDELGCWLPAREATAGIGVDGSTLEPGARDEDRPLRVGLNIATTELESSSVRLTSTIEGMLLLDEHEVPFVTETLELNGDVGLRTGNIDARGSVVVSGNVNANFIIKATGDITVRGLVENASLRAQGQITIEQTLLGTDFGKVVAAGDVHVNNSQNANIESLGSIHLGGSDSGSLLNCSGDLFAIDGRGALRGGHYQAGGSVKVRSLGSDLGAPTLVFAGLDPILERERERLRLALKQVRADERKGARAKQPGQGAQVKASRQAERQRTRLTNQLKRLNDREPKDPNPVVVALEEVHYGVIVHIGKLSLPIQHSTDGRRFLLSEDSGEIETHPL